MRVHVKIGIRVRVRALRLVLWLSEGLWLEVQFYG